MIQSVVPQCIGDISWRRKVVDSQYSKLIRIAPLCMSPKETTINIEYDQNPEIITLSWHEKNNNSASILKPLPIVIPVRINTMVSRSGMKTSKDPIYQLMFVQMRKEKSDRL